MEDISKRADLARATFYAHYPNKEAAPCPRSSSADRRPDAAHLLQQRALGRGPPDATRIAYQHAAEMADLYRACLSN